MRTQVVTDVDALGAHEDRWWDLFARVPDATPFASPAWLLPWWRTFAPGTLFVITVSDADRLVGLAPLYIEMGALGRRLLPLGIGISDMLDILLDPTHAADAAGLIGREVSRSAGDGGIRWSAEEAPPGAAVLAMADPMGWCSTVTIQSASPVLPLPGQGSALRNVVPARKWRKWQMARHRAGRRDWSIEHATAASLGDDLAHLVRLHGARWAGRGEPGVLADERVRRFHDAAAPALLAHGMLRLTVLRLDGKVAGVCYCLSRGTETCAYLSGFDPAFAFESPGTLLIGAAIEHAVCEGSRSFNFLCGQEGYKYEWGASDRWNSRRLFEPMR